MTATRLWALTLVAFVATYAIALAVLTDTHLAVRLARGLGIG